MLQLLKRSGRDTFTVLTHYGCRVIVAIRSASVLTNIGASKREARRASFPTNIVQRRLSEKCALGNVTKLGRTFGVMLPVTLSNCAVGVSRASGGPLWHGVTTVPRSLQCYVVTSRLV